MERVDTLILGGGLAGLSLADRLGGSVLVIEGADAPGGLCRSYEFCGVSCDVGPHIIFSRNKRLTDELCSLASTAQLRRSNRIFHKGRFVKYPFENELSALEPAERDYCLKEFLENPRREAPAGNMQDFFLKTFGRGITELYLGPYNRKIWKYDPAQMDTQMVERIPRPPDEDVIRSARGESTEGYEHQLYFHYPQQGGTESLIKGLLARLSKEKRVLPSAKIQRLSRQDNGWVVHTDKGEFAAGRLVNCMPLPQLFRFVEPSAEVKAALGGILHNSIHIVLLRAKKDRLGDNFAVMCADENV
ncbi:MAG TPA: NAD(P)-binding protein, partial [Elusimicrobiales bacterium]|nr:NAD(P)-binding protein [Elusimicrobiales bacterium]